MFLKTIKGLLLTAFFLFAFSKGARAMLLREKSLRESFFTQLIDEIVLIPEQKLTQQITLNYEKPLGIEILFRNPSEQKALGILKLKDSGLKILAEKEFFVSPRSNAGFYFFSFPELENPRAKKFWLEITNNGKIPLIIGYYNQNVYHYGELYLGKELQPGVLQFQIHYQINLFLELSEKLKTHLQKEQLFFYLWIGIIIIMAVLAIILAKDYSREVKK